MKIKREFNAQMITRCFSTTKRGSSNARIFDTGEKNVQRQHMELLYMLSGLQRKIDRDIGSM